MSKNIEMNIKQDNGQYEIVYPKTNVGNIIDITDNYFNKNQTRKNSTAEMFGLSAEALPDDIFVKIKTLIDMAQTTADNAPKIVLGSYAGNGKQGKSYPNSLTANFPIKLVIVYGYRITSSNMSLFANYGSYGSDFSVWIMPLSDITTEFDYNNQFGIVKTAFDGGSKKSADSKTFYWYQTYKVSNDGDSQFNMVNTTYYYILIG